MKKRKIVLASTILLAMIGPYTVKAAETVSEEPTVTESAESEGVTVEQVMTMIDGLKGENTTRDDVEKAENAYETLTTAQKLQVENYDDLQNAKEKYLADEQTGGAYEDTQKQKNGTEYNFRISNYTKQLTLTLRLIVDADGDGNMDVPEIYFISPSNEKYIVGVNESILSNDECNIDIVRTSNYIQLNVTSAAEGVWQVETDTRVVFEASDYADDQQTESFEPTEGVQTEETAEANANVKEKKGTNPIVLFGFLVVVAAVFVLIKKIFSSKDKGENKTVKETTSKEEIIRPLTPEEEIAKIRAEWEEAREEYADEEEEIVPEPMQGAEDDMAQTIEDFEEDDDLEEFDIDFFGHSRFKKPEE